MTKRGNEKMTKIRMNKEQRRTKRNGEGKIEDQRSKINA
jgi:hypothetical protein